MSDEADVVFFRIPLCGKCKQVATNLADVEKLHPEIRVNVYTLPDHINLAWRYGLLTVPALIIRGSHSGA
ncbi:MAG: hypothetical protein ABSA11_10365 [Candidatus Bathyarchaeia archaeon]|jgi:hypothetical protein